MLSIIGLRRHSVLITKRLAMDWKINFGNKFPDRWLAKAIREGRIVRGPYISMTVTTTTGNFSNPSQTVSAKYYVSNTTVRALPDAVPFVVDGGSKR